MSSRRTTFMSDAMDSAGFRLQRHIEVVYTAPYHFNTSHVRRVKICTGIILEFVLHQHPLTWEPSTDDGASNEDEVRVVFVMGFLSSKETWAPTIETMLRQWEALKTGKRLKILTFDNRGVGSSTSPIGPYNMAEDILALLDHIGWQQTHVIGLLVLLYPPKFLSQNMENDPRSIYEAMFECHKYLVENREIPRVFGLMGQGSAVLSHFVSDERLHAIRDQHFLILVVGGSKDVVIPARETQTLYNHLASDHSRMVMYEDAGHDVYIKISTMLSDGVLLAISLGGLVATVLLVLFLAGFFAGTKKVAHEDQAEVVRGGERGGLAALRKRKDRKKRNTEREEAVAPVEAAAPAHNEAVEAAEEEEGPVEPYVTHYKERAMTKKELQKELKRREREELRRFDQQQREERQRMAEEKEAAYQKKREEEDKIEAALEEQERKVKEEKERKEKEEFDQWKDMFTIEEQGSKLTEDTVRRLR
ncbi:uncharacterized protein PITG_15927 [Phytophthora infestans T30-4]|uniref:AB hydrolase-1 domain-containing protein n=1 Tax=Phytophthora infestans (strain T30-4) TaxID=403677 RepID=D0NS26_PHYIT|nr:uncharacterized protein PITG_15927 [Phytophthora infestans T30-4]EEY63567.1 conserved hypothetical protein [Phytophthora infestans T30-4]|eukprot:XP_002898154.1 conserved hypothetical protein [Phytophthora infestans T30-4]